MMLKRHLTCGLAAASICLPAGYASAESDSCAVTPEPVISLSYGSRYADNDDSRSEVDEASNSEVNEALKPIDDFLRELVADANEVLRSGPEKRDLADCVVSRLAEWAEADALSDLGSFNAGLSIGARYAGFAFVYRQVRPYSERLAEGEVIEDWLSARIDEQMTFWEEEATPGAKTGNLRAWAALAVNLVGDLTENDAALRWSEWSATYVMCHALEDGSLPQEMKRGKYALHYQLHAIAPLTVTAALLEQQDLSIREACNEALPRIVAYALGDLEAGESSEAYSGKKQSYFDGTEKLESHEMAWLEAYLSLYPDPEIEAVADKWRPLGNSKLGGDQELLWGHSVN